MIKRKDFSTILNMFGDANVVYINGPRQCGKSTLAMSIAEYLQMQYVTFDDYSVLAAAKHDPVSFVQNIKGDMTLDEIQLVPEIFRNLKIFVDEQRQKQGKIKLLLTGSANITALPGLSDALVGRMQIRTLYPFSLTEFRDNDFIEQIFTRDFKEQNRQYIISDLIKTATFPELSLAKKMNASNWFDSYITTLLSRDVRALTSIEKSTDMFLMLKILAARTGSLMNESSLARDCNMNLMTFRRYRSLLENMFVIQRVFPWFRNVGKRFVKTAKNYFLDTCMLSYLSGTNVNTAQEENPVLFGHILENFVYTELIKNVDKHTQLFHFRTTDGTEVDFVLEKNNGDIVGIEVKSSSMVSVTDFRGLKVLQIATGSSFKCGIVLYLGKHVIPFGMDLYAVPIGAL
ncbi:MAG: ATP-binding protein [Holosporaceae bacterium]|jgi:predicted AAA+ superfamily ATPase|nr:ATP-binding protein [Holosporaceae bacterium]